MGWSPHRARIHHGPNPSTAPSPTSTSSGTPTSGAPSSLVLLLLLILTVENYSFPTDEKMIKMCSDRLLQGIQSFCRNPGSFQYMMALTHKRKRSHSFQDEMELGSQLLPRLTSRGGGGGGGGYDQEEEEVDEEGDEDSGEDFQDLLEDDGDELFQGEASTYTAFNLEAQRKNIVEACCRNACSENEFLQYCKISRQGERRKSPVTTTTTTTTTTPSPIQSQTMEKVNHNLSSRHRLSLGTKKTRSEAEIRADLIREAIRCLYDPKCGRLQNESGSISQIPMQKTQNNYNGSKMEKKKKSRIKIPPPFTKFCSQGWRKHVMTKEEKQSHLLPLLLRMLTWGIPKSPEVTPEPQPQYLPRVADPPAFSSSASYNFRDDGDQLSPGIRGRSNRIPQLPAKKPSRLSHVGNGAGGGEGGAGGKFGVPSFTHRGHTPGTVYGQRQRHTTGQVESHSLGQGHGQGHSNDHTHAHTHSNHRPPPISNQNLGFVDIQEGGGGDEGEEEESRPIVTDPPIKPNLGFGLRTQDGVLFNN